MEGGGVRELNSFRRLKKRPIYQSPGRVLCLLFSRLTRLSTLLLDSLVHQQQHSLVDVLYILWQKGVDINRYQRAQMEREGPAMATLLVSSSFFLAKCIAVHLTSHSLVVGLTSRQDRLPHGLAQNLLLLLVDHVVFGGSFNSLPMWLAPLSRSGPPTTTPTHILVVGSIIQYLSSPSYLVKSWPQKEKNPKFISKPILPIATVFFFFFFFFFLFRQLSFLLLSMPTSASKEPKK